MSSRSKLDWYKRNPAKFIGGTAGMTFELKGAYSIVLDLIYDGGGSCADDARWIANLLGVEMTTRRWNIIRGKLIESGKLVAINGRLANPAASRMLARDAALAAASGPVPQPVLSQDKTDFIPPDKTAQTKTDLFAANGLTPSTPPPDNALPARAPESQSQNQNQKETRPGPAVPSQVQVIVQVELIATTLGQKRGQYWERDYRRLLEDGLMPEFILEAAKAHRGDPIKGINALKGLALVKQKAAFERDPPSPPPAPAPVHSDKAWGVALSGLLASGTWLASEYGICPTRPGHSVPPALYEQWLVLWEKQGSHPIAEYDRSGNKGAYPVAQPSDVSRSLWEPKA
jgi:hypothetical protein